MPMHISRRLVLAGLTLPSIVRAQAASAHRSRRASPNTARKFC